MASGMGALVQIAMFWWPCYKLMISILKSSVRLWSTFAQYG